MKLANIQDVLERMQLKSMVGVGDNSSIESAIVSATSMVESILRTPVEYASRIDYFDNTRGRYDTYEPSTLILTQKYLI